MGAQWGDEGKGKIIDYLAPSFDVIARANGGANAGHTIVVSGEKRVFHLVPAASLHEGKPVILGAGMVIHLPTLAEEIMTLRGAGIDIVPRLFISRAAHIVFEYHKAIDAVLEERRREAKGEGIGTTRRGIGPAYTDKAARFGIRMEMLKDTQALKNELTAHVMHVQAMYGVEVDVNAELEAIKEATGLVSERVTDAVKVLHDHLHEGRRILIEGAQGSLLDIDHGTYPHVTSSATTVAGALHALGLPPRALSSSIGVAKAYCTRVGGGPFPTEAEAGAADRLRQRGGEYGATTGRPRRCGWLSLPDLRRVGALNGFTCWNITKLDVLDQEKMIPVSIEERSGKAEYKELPGWEHSTHGVTEFKKLPKQARDYIAFIEQETGIPVSLIGTGQEREAMVIRG